MIAYLNGTILAQTSTYIILNTNNVGYLVFMPTEILHKYQIQQTGAFYIYTIVREQEISLYGFETLAERNFFELLISVSGIGPKSALEFLNLPVDLIQNAISSGDIAFLSKVKGVGKKTAERLIVELKNKLGSIMVAHIDLPQHVSEDNSHNDLNDVILALENLGYDRFNIIKSLKNAPSQSSTEDLIRWFLQNVK